MQPSMFNVRVPLRDRDDVFLMNTFTDAQLIVSRDVVGLLDSLGAPDADASRRFNESEQAALDTLTSNGFIVSDRASERAALDRYFHDFRESTNTLRVTILTTLQCNFACDYCIQGDHGDYNKHATKMSIEEAARVAEWIEERLDTLKPRLLFITFFGGEPLLNVPVMFALAQRLFQATQARGIRQAVNVITNGLLLTREIVERLNPLGLNGIKVTLDGDRETHDRMRPLRGGQGTFDRIIRNIRAVSDICNITLGGNFDETSVDSYPALLDFLREQDFADRLGEIFFKPVIRPPQPAQPKGLIPLTPVDANNKPLGGSCMTGAGHGSERKSSICDTCHFVDEKMTFLHGETIRHGFQTLDGVHMGPCEIHHRHSYTIGPNGSLYACPGFAGEASQSVGHIDGRVDPARESAAARFETMTGWKKCGDCEFIPVCGGGCSVAALTEGGDLQSPSCHKPFIESSLVTLAHQVAEA